MHLVRFELTIPAIKQAKTIHALDRAPLYIRSTRNAGHFRVWILGNLTFYF
jgi:hypothetical protein